MTTVFENPTNGYRVKVNSFSAFIWASIFGPFYFLARGNMRHFILGLLLTGLIIPWLIYPFFAASILRTMYCERGYLVVGAPESRASSVAILLVLLLIGAAVFCLRDTSTNHSVTSRSSVTLSAPPTNSRADSTKAQTQVRRALPVSQSMPILIPFQSSPTPMGLSQTEPKAKEGNGKSDTRIQVQAGTTSRFADEPEIRRPLPINLYDHQTVAAATPAIVKTKEVIVQSIRKTWVQIQCEDDHSPPVFEDWIFPEAHPLKVRGTKFWILIRDPDAVKIWKDRQSVEITGNKVIID